MRIACCCLFLTLLLPLPGIAADQSPLAAPEPLPLEFSGFRFGQPPAANMTCFTGYCKSQAPGGDGRVAFPFSIYETPGAVTTLSALTIVLPRYTFWEDRLFRVVFQVDCTPLEVDECLDDITVALDREYTLTPLSSSDQHQFAAGRRAVTREYQTDSGAFIKVRAVVSKDGPHLPWIDIVDRRMADMVGSTLNPSYKPKLRALSETPRKP
jgi:hypothetical protein